MKFRLLSYNIHKGIGGLDRRYRPQRIIDTIKHYAADVILLQEVDDGVPRSRFHRQVDFLGEELGFQHRAFQANVKLKQGGYGNAILSRFPMDEIIDIDLTVPPKKRRRALLVRLHLRSEGHTRSAVIVNIHLGLAGYERAIQSRRLLQNQAITHLRESTPMIVGGDFNDVWASLGRKVFEPAGFQLAAGKFKTFPAAYPVRPLDRIYYRGELKFCSGFGGHTNLAREASDHLPIIADFEILSKQETNSSSQ